MPNLQWTVMCFGGQLQQHDAPLGWEETRAIRRRLDTAFIAAQPVAIGRTVLTSWQWGLLEGLTGATRPSHARVANRLAKFAAAVPRARAHSPRPPPVLAV